LDFSNFKQFIPSLDQTQKIFLLCNHLPHGSGMESFASWQGHGLQLSHGRGMGSFASWQGHGLPLSHGKGMADTDSLASWIRHVGKQGTYI
jgi:hypothetical protein